MSEEEVAFLKDQVHRLSASLSKYQNKYLQLPPDDGPLKSSDPKAPWIMNKKFLSPLLAEYDHTVEELNQQISMYQVDLESMTSRVEKVTEENSQLHSELRRSIEAQIQAATLSGSGKSKLNDNRDVSEMLDTLQKQLEVVSSDRERYRDLLKKTSEELEILHRNDQVKTKRLLESKTEALEAQQDAGSSKQALEELQFTCAKLTEERARCLKAMKTQEAELSSIQEKFSQMKTEHKASSIKNQEMKRALDNITLQLRKRESERARAMDTENTLDDRIHIMQINTADLEGKLLAAQREGVILAGEKTDLEEALALVQSRVSALEKREYEAVCHVKESMQVAESALLEKDQASIREKQLAGEVDRLKSAMTTIVKEAGERTRREADLLREECNRSIDKMGVEIHRLEQECGERRAELERCQREKKIAEKELDKARAQKPLEMVQVGENLHELQKRVCVAERARDDMALKLEALGGTARRLESSLSDEKKDNVKLTEEHRKWQKQVQEESTLLRKQKIKAMSHADEFQQKVRHSEQGKEAAELKLVQEISAMAQRQEMREKEMAYRLESCEEAHQKSIQELRQLLTAQHRVGAKWREESKALAHKFEHTISNLKTELLRYKERSNVLSTQLNHLKHIKDDLGKQLNKATSSNASLQQRLKEVETQAEESMDQVSQLLSKEKQLLQERRELHRQLDKFKLHMTRSAGMGMPVSSHVRGGGGTLQGSALKNHSLQQRMQPNLPQDIQFHSSSPPPITPYPQDNMQWNHTLSQLKHSIQQVRDELGLREHGERRSKVQEEDHNDTASEYSTLSRGDLSRSNSVLST